jgi:hypothetical protein
MCPISVDDSVVLSWNDEAMKTEVEELVIGVFSSSKRRAVWLNVSHQTPFIRVVSLA